MNMAELGAAPGALVSLLQIAAGCAPTETCAQAATPTGTFHPSLGGGSPATAYKSARPFLGVLVWKVKAKTPHAIGTAQRPPPQTACRWMGDVVERLQVPATGPAVIRYSQPESSICRCAPERQSQLHLAAHSHSRQRSGKAPAAESTFSTACRAWIPALQ